MREHGRAQTQTVRSSTQEPLDHVAFIVSGCARQQIHLRHAASQIRRQSRERVRHTGWVAGQLCATQPVILKDKDGRGPGVSHLYGAYFPGPRVHARFFPAGGGCDDLRQRAPGRLPSSRAFSQQLSHRVSRRRPHERLLPPGAHERRRSEWLL